MRPLRLVALLLGALLLAYAIPAVVFLGEVPPGTRVAGVDVGGLSPGGAAARLRRELGARAVRPLAVEAGGERVRLAPQELGLSLDVPGTVAAAHDGWPSPALVARSLFGGRDIQPVVRVDRARLDAAVAKLAKRVDRPAREGSVRFDGLEVRTAASRPGRKLDRAAAGAALRAGYLRSEAVRLPVAAVAPAVPPEEVERAAALARTAVAAPLTVTNGTRRVTLSRQDLAAHLRFTPDGGRLVPAFDAKGIAGRVQAALVDRRLAPKDARFEIVGGRPRIVPSRPGQGVDPAALGRAIAETLTRGGDRIVAAPITRRQPELTTEEARKLGIREKVSSFTTRHPCCAPRVRNIHRIADILDGHLVMPGETFSLNGVVGRRDRARGFVEAPMILNGRFVEDVGGGVSQFATTMFNAVFFGGFEDVQHKPHQFYISRYPAGRESTVSYPQPDFRWRNDSPYGVLVTTSYTDTSITVEFWSTKRFDIEARSSERYNVRDFPTLSDSGPDCIPMEGAEGFAIDVWRIFKKDGKVVKREKFHTVYDPEPRLTCS
ncbi:VanW family protein [Thermoactinospora rubra]|uniref:VanW family protein n=1 Tax=Thermoactinospora rubra TaxID=1088767 RepID=UPI000A120147|nr:VanW family protein [Thermoactinospora rubra]